MIWLPVKCWRVPSVAVVKKPPLLPHNVLAAFDVLPVPLALPPSSPDSANNGKAKAKARGKPNSHRVKLIERSLRVQTEAH